ncbi:MAG TPA: RNA methyltransferase [Gammaproteobacteria bacterium]|nr:RNA methyltransferase [Gammaproteobacteria bacterium]
MWDNIHFVLVNPTHPGNIGAAARAMKNMGLRHLALVKPKLYPSAEATARASGADDILAAARVHDCLEQALESCDLVIGASARPRSIAWPSLGARECADMISGEGARRRVAILFGREHAGLTNAELDRCHYLLHIPCSAQYPSLNLAAAVQIVAYELLMAAGSAPVVADTGENAANSAEMERFYRHLEQVLVDVAFLDPGHPKKLMRRLRRVFNRARPDRQELNILRGILSAVQQARASLSKP